MPGFRASSPCGAHPGIRLVGLGPGRATLRLPFREALVTAGDVGHGGAIRALVDTTAMATAWSTADAPANLRGTTVALSVDFVTAARAQDLTAVGRVIRRGRTLVFCEVEVRDASQVVAVSLVTYKLG